MARILVVDDDPDFVEIVRMLLQSRGHLVDAASSDELAFQSMDAHTPDIILLDMMLSFVLDGFTIARKMRESPTLKEIPILVVSSLTEQQCRSMCPGCGWITLDGWITKPIHPEVLFQEVESRLNRPLPDRQIMEQDEAGM